MKSPFRKTTLLIFAVLLLGAIAGYFAWHSGPIQMAMIIGQVNSQTQRAEAAVKSALAKPKPDAINDLRRLLREGDDIQQVKALIALDQLGDDAISAAPEMVSLLSEHFASINKHAEIVLHRFGDKLSPVADDLIVLLIAGKYAWERMSAARLLRNCRSSAAKVLPALELATMKDKDFQVRFYAVHSAVEIATNTDQTERLIPFLEAAAKDSSDEVRANAQSWLVQFRKKSEPSKPPTISK